MRMQIDKVNKVNKVDEVSGTQSFQHCRLTFLPLAVDFYSIFKFLILL